MATPARRIAAEVLMRVAQDGAFANLALDAALRQAGALEPREVALATELTYGTLRWQLQLDRALSAHSDRALDDLDEPVRVALRLGAFELLHHEKVPARAAVNEAVELAKELNAARATGFVNAVLRRLSETRASPPPPSSEVDPVGHVAALTSHPRWIVERWMRWLGPAEAEQLCLANQQQAAATVRVARRKATPARVQEVLRESGIDSRPGRYRPDALVLADGAPPSRSEAASHAGRRRSAGTGPGASARGGAAIRPPRRPARLRALHADSGGVRRAGSALPGGVQPVRARPASAVVSGGLPGPRLPPYIAASHEHRRFLRCPLEENRMTDVLIAP